MRKRDIASLLVKTTRDIMVPKIMNQKEYNPHNFDFDITVRIGTGASTYVSSFNPFHQPNQKCEFTCTFGQKMVESKKNKKNASGWTTGKEILQRGYFNKNLTLQNVLIHTILHETAHIVQSLMFERKRGSVHNKDFYFILNDFYKKEYHLEIKEYLSNFDVFTSLYFDKESDVKIYNRMDTLGLDYIIIDSRGKEECLKITKRNLNSCISTTIDGRYSLKVPYTLIKKAYNKIPPDFLTDKFGNKIVTFDDILKEIKTGKEILVKTKYGQEWLRIEEIKPKEVIALDTKRMLSYSVPIALILKIK